MFYQPDETGRPGRGTVGKLVSKAGAYVALRVDSSDPKVAHLETYDRVRKLAGMDCVYTCI